MVKRRCGSRQLGDEGAFARCFSLQERSTNTHIRSMFDEDFSGQFEVSTNVVSEGVPGSSAATMGEGLSTIASPLIERQDGAWRVLPIKGQFAFAYEDGIGAWSVRHLAAHELKIGPGRVLASGPITVARTA